MSAVAELRFRRMTAGDLQQLHEWLHRPHVERWWHPGETLAEVEAHYRPRLDGDEAVDLYFALDGDQAIAYLQTYLYDHSTAGVDLFIADETRTGRGLGPALIRQFVDDVVFARTETTACTPDPEIVNARSIRAFEKAGFVVVREFDEPSDGKRHVLLRKDRSRPEAASQSALERT